MRLRQDQPSPSRHPLPASQQHPQLSVRADYRSRLGREL